MRKLPGGSSTGFGNFLEIGPLDINLQPRAATWLQLASLLFVDNPVGTGWSYVDDASLLTTNEDQIAADLVTLVAAFFQAHPAYAAVPFVVFSESYGGKMATSFSNALLDAIAGGRVKCNFRAVALGDSWISPVDSVESWTPLLYQTGLVDDATAAGLAQQAQGIAAAVQQHQWATATSMWGDFEGSVQVCRVVSSSVFSHFCKSVHFLPTLFTD